MDDNKDIRLWLDERFNRLFDLNTAAVQRLEAVEDKTDKNAADIAALKAAQGRTSGIIYTVGGFFTFCLGALGILWDKLHR